MIINSYVLLLFTHSADFLTYIYVCAYCYYLSREQTRIVFLFFVGFRCRVFVWCIVVLIVVTSMCLLPERFG